MRIKPREIILTYKRNNCHAYKTAFSLGIHPTTVYRWVLRSKSKVGVTSSSHLKRKSTRPKTIKRFEFTPNEKVEIARIRADKGWMSEKIVKFLGFSCHPKTLHRYLKRHHFVRKYGYHRRPRFQNTLHMHAKNTKTIGYLQFDVKYITPELSGLPYTCFEYAVIDIFSRYKEAVILNHLDQDGSMAAILEIFPKLPFKPGFIQTDNGLEFQGRFHRMCEDIRIRHHMIHKNTPNENALIERSFRTDEEEFFFRINKAPSNYDELRVLFSEWLYEYNNTRPHLGLNLKTPKEIVADVLSG